MDTQQGRRKGLTLGRLIRRAILVVVALPFVLAVLGAQSAYRSVYGSHWTAPCPSPAPIEKYARQPWTNAFEKLGPPSATFGEPGDPVDVPISTKLKRHALNALAVVIQPILPAPVLLDSFL
jgi:hypothetical protein